MILTAMRMFQSVRSGDVAYSISTHSRGMARHCEQYLVSSEKVLMMLMLYMLRLDYQ
jgi:hypothetical protein